MVQRLKAPFENEMTHIVIGASIGVAAATRSSDPGELPVGPISLSITPRRQAGIRMMPCSESIWMSCYADAER